MKKVILMLCAAALLFASCGESKTFRTHNGETVRVEPYGWLDNADKNDSVSYQLCTSNLILDVVFCETIVVPVVLTATQLYEPVCMTDAVELNPN